MIQPKTAKAPSLAARRDCVAPLSGRGQSNALPHGGLINNPGGLRDG
ncbi:hypothetical protein ACI6QG_05450 [Roseococcus sp. DSY-14]